MTKIIKILAVNFLIFIFLIASFEIITYFVCLKHYKETKVSILPLPKFKYMCYPPIHQTDIITFFDGTNNTDRGRLPDGTDYNGIPIVIFGCSFAYGWGLKPNQTFSYKLSEILKRPVYNRAVSGQSFQEMYYQTKKLIFYDLVKKSDTVIYVLMDDHFRRMYVNSVNVLFSEVLLHYDIKDNNELVYERYSNPLKNLFNSLYTVKVIKEKYINYFLNKPENAEKITDDALLYFIKSRENLEEKWGEKINFYVLFYGNIPYSDILKDKLQKNDFMILDTKEMTEENLYDTKYFSKEISHPSEDAWDLLTPIVAKEIIENEPK